MCLMFFTKCVQIFKLFFISVWGSRKTCLPQGQCPSDYCNTPLAQYNSALYIEKYLLIVKSYQHINYRFLTCTFLSIEWSSWKNVVARTTWKSVFEKWYFLTTLVLRLSLSEVKILNLFSINCENIIRFEFTLSLSEYISY